MSNKDVARDWWRFTSRKTGAAMAAKPLTAWLAKHASKTGSVFPVAAARVESAQGRAGTLSNQFYVILARAGLVEPRPHAATGKDRGARRSTGSLSFHYLRNTTNTMLKEAGAPESVAMAILDHKSR